MRKTTLCLSILLAVAVSTAAQAKKHHHHMMAPAASAAAVAGKPNGYAWPGTPFLSATQDQRNAFLGAAINPMGAK